MRIGRARRWRPLTALTGVTGLLGKNRGFGCCPRLAPPWQARAGGQRRAVNKSREWEGRGHDCNENRAAGSA